MAGPKDGASQRLGPLSCQEFYDEVIMRLVSSGRDLSGIEVFEFAETVTRGRREFMREEEKKRQADLNELIRRGAYGGQITR